MMKLQSAVAAVAAFAMAAGMSSTIYAQQITVSGSGSGALENPALANGAVAFGQCVFDRTAQTISCTSRVYNIVDLTAGHIHIGAPGASGGVIIPIPNLPLRISGSWGQSWTWTASDFVPQPAVGLTTFDSFMNACVAGGCYLNWHTTTNGGGAVRVNLCPKSAGANTANGIAVCEAP